MAIEVVAHLSPTAVRGVAVTPTRGLAGGSSIRDARRALIHGRPVPLLRRAVTSNVFVTGIKAIDILAPLRTLADTHGERAIGVILSGARSEGPQSAVSADCVDFVLPPEPIAGELVRLAGHPYVGPAKTRMNRWKPPRTSSSRPTRRG